MNFLAHSYFIKDKELTQLGNIFGDFYKGKPEKMELPKEFIEGLIKHRKLDFLTDSSNAVSNGKKRLNEFGRYSGIILDIYYDHFLSLSWGKLCECELESHCENIKNLIEKNNEFVPDDYSVLVEKLISESWFVKYSDLQFIDITFRRVSRQIKGENNLRDAGDFLRANYSFFQENFNEFFSEVLKPEYLKGDENDL